ncbi:hypothetical protein CFD26_104545 [Aspergillus turcosus]|uniref:Uncharacterized protein n=1 Tax=Aspergillus turcosus TaxID=1245748 RepID=A0A3R7F5Y2_9EURO|nr:hypothetical protein CFD26_104545 [Aspergillus turcosus]
MTWYTKHAIQSNVKIRGKRVQLNEVEQYVQQRCVESDRIIPDMVAPADDSENPLPTVFIWPKEHADCPEVDQEATQFAAASTIFRAKAAQIKKELGASLLEYMIPRLFETRQQDLLQLHPMRTILIETGGGDILAMQVVLRRDNTHAKIIQCSAFEFKTAYSIRLPSGRKGRESLPKLTIYAVAEGGYPTSATVPCRIRVDKTRTVEAALKAIQDNATSMIPLEQAGLQNMRRMTREAHVACGFQSFVSIQLPAETASRGYLIEAMSASDSEYTFPSYAPNVVRQLRANNDGFSTSVRFDPRIVSSEKAESIMERF